MSDYCALVGGALAAAGEEVHVWAPPAAETPGAGPVNVHRLPGRFDPASLREMWRGIDALPSPRRLFVQYVTGAWGYKALNFLFCGSILRRRGDTVWVMFHEYAYPLGRHLKLSHNMLGLLTPVMAAMVAARADRIFVSTPAWEPRIPAGIRRRLRHPVRWLPVPANIAEAPARDRVARIRSALAPQGQTVIGHFGTYGPSIAGLLAGILPPLLRPEGRLALLVGRGGDAWAGRMAESRPELRGRLVATGSLPPPEVAAHLAACDLLVQPYEDGVTSRRSSLMAALALGLPVVSNAGSRSEPLFAQRQAVALAGDPAGALVRMAEELLASASRRTSLGERARSLYEERFSLEHTLAILREEAGAEERALVL